MTPREHLAEIDPELMIADGWDEAIIGVVHRFGQEPVVLYDKGKILEEMISQGSTQEEAEEYFQYNIVGCWIGEKTPAFADLFS